jgi:hypothetical protein
MWPTSTWNHWNNFGKQLISCNISTLDEAAVRNDQLD